MALLEIIGLTLQAGSLLFGANATRKAARQQRQFAERAAQDVLARGEEDVGIYQRQLSQLMGRQRVAGAAQGLDITQGTAAQIGEQTQRIGEQDVEMIRRNAQREAWGIRTQANLNYQAARNQAIGAGIQAAGMIGPTLLGGAQDAWTSYVGGRKPRGTTTMRTPGVGNA